MKVRQSWMSRMFYFESTEPPAEDPPADPAGDPPAEPEPDEVGAASDGELDTLESSLTDEFNTLYDGEAAPDAEALARLAEIADDLDKIRTERTRRAEEQAEMQRKAEELRQRVAPPEETPPVEAPTGVVPEPVAAGGNRVAAVDALKPRRRSLNASLADVRRHAPAVELDSRPSLAMIAAAGIPTEDKGGRINDMEELGNAFQHRASQLSDNSGRVTIATIPLDFPTHLSKESSVSDVWDVISRARDQEALVAAGGWCAPSTNLYNFFNIVCDDGLVDLPTVGIDRGGINFPVSATLGDILADADSVWNWTETDDQAAATGSPTKPCVRVPCPEFTEVRLACDGICITAGNLMDSAFPELIRNHVALTMSAHLHTINAQHIARMATLSTAVTPANGGGGGVVAQLLAAVDLAAVDYRERFGMCENDVLEVVLPRWVKGAFRSDLSRRGGVDGWLGLSAAEIAAWFDARNIRTQFVADWQTRGEGAAGTATPGDAAAALTAWPTAVQFMIFAAGTFVRGNGPTINLGALRDSTMNETNDFTLSWSEECTLIARIGHLSRRYTVQICPDGRTGIPTALTCPAA